MIGPFKVGRNGLTRLGFRVVCPGDHIAPFRRVSTQGDRVEDGRLSFCADESSRGNVVGLFSRESRKPGVLHTGLLVLLMYSLDERDTLLLGPRLSELGNT